MFTHTVICIYIYTYTYMGVLKIRGTLLGDPIIRTKVFGGLYWGPSILGNYHISIYIINACYDFFERLTRTLYLVKNPSPHAQTLKNNVLGFRAQVNLDPENKPETLNSLELYLPPKQRWTPMSPAFERTGARPAPPPRV